MSGQTIDSGALLEIIDKLVARRLTQREWAENAANQGQPDWAARYGSVADAFTEAIDMLDALISNSVLDRNDPPNSAVPNARLHGREESEAE